MKVANSLNFKLLGLELDKQLSFDVSTDYLRKKISKRIGILNRIKAYLPKSEGILYYNPLIKPLILHCSVTWTSSWNHDNIRHLDCKNAVPVSSLTPKNAIAV